MRKILIALAFLFTTSFSFGQYGSKYGTDSIACVTNLKSSTTFFKKGNYTSALEPWRYVFYNCPAVSEDLYVTGDSLLRNLIRNENDTLLKSKYIDTLIYVYEMQSAYFGKKGLVAGKLGLMLYEFSPQKKEVIRKELKKSIDSEGIKSGYEVTAKYYRVNLDLYREKKISKEDILDMIYLVNEITEANLTGNEAGNFRTLQNQTKEYFDSFMTCEEISAIYEPLFKTKSDDADLLRKIVTLHNMKRCTNSQVYKDAAEKLHMISPGSFSAITLARINVTSQTFTKASQFYNDAVEFESDYQKKAAILIESAEFQLRTLKNYSQSRTLAQRASLLQPDWGKPWMLLGDIYSAGSSACKEEFRGTVAFWVSADNYLKAKEVDAAFAKEADHKLIEISKYYPDKEALKTKKLSAGDLYFVKCWINEKTTVRAKK